ncbi:uncharacterized protein LOC9646529 [Selaginella moellendorffii]|nr:uncharacterized protein LOC9646529 [Selaginella moellendorffii]|eukprot:XP_002976226.2 uncharacterized protein LOC9646529 [Selaginella moellendorffii]
MAKTKKHKTNPRKKRKKGSDCVALSCLEAWSRCDGAVLVDLHCHTTCSDGLLSPPALVERAHKRGVKVLALTDHDTMAGVPAAIAAARSYGMRIIPGVEISCRYLSSSGEMGELVHVLAYYGCCGPAQGLEERLARIREGRYARARSMVDKLRDLKKPVRWESVLEFAGDGVAPGRPHVARALVQAGHVSSVGEAFHKYLHDGGPAYSNGSELPAGEAVELIRETGGIAVLAHPWSLKNPLDVVKQLKDAGLHGMEVYKSSGRDKAFADLADAYHLVKLGGSDFHGTGAADETDLGNVEVPAKALHEFLRAGDPVWLDSVMSILSSFAAGTITVQSPDCDRKEAKSNRNTLDLSGDAELRVVSNGTALKLSSWLSEEEKQRVVAAAAEAHGLDARITDGRGEVLVTKIRQGD